MSILLSFQMYKPPSLSNLSHDYSDMGRVIMSLDTGLRPDPSMGHNLDSPLTPELPSSPAHRLRGLPSDLNGVNVEVGSDVTDFDDIALSLANTK